MKGKKILFLAFAIVLGISSCQKDEEFTTRNTNNGEEKIMSVDPTEANILNFIERMDAVREDPDIEDVLEWNYSQDSALWYVEASMNYTYAYPNKNRAKLLKDSCTASYQVNQDGKVNIAEIEGVLQKVKDSISVVYNNIEEEYKFLIGLDFLQVETYENIYKIRYYIGLFDVSLPDGDWRVTTAGMCDGSYQGFGSTDKIEQELFNSNDIHELDVFFTDQDPLYYCNQYCDVNQNFAYTPCDVSALYSQSCWNSADFLNCLDVFRMNNYINNAIFSIDYIQNQFNKNIYIADIFWDFKLILIGQEPYYHWHQYDGVIAKPRTRAYFNQSEEFLY